MADGKRNDVLPPSSPGLTGHVSFDYSSYDGRYVIGSGDRVFETRWTSRGQGSIYVTNDPAGIRGVAIANGLTDLSQVTAQTIRAADFTSRVRTANEGEIVLFENHLGLFGAAKIEKVTAVANNGQTRLEFSYAISRQDETILLADENGNILSTESGDALAVEYAPPEDYAAPIFSLYGNPTAADIAEQAARLEADFARLLAVAVHRPEHGGIGHNQPPDDLPLVEADIAATSDALRTIASTALRPGGDKSILNAALLTIANAGAAIAEWAAKKADIAATAFAEQFGKTAASPSVLLGAWLIFGGQLSQLVEAAAKYVMG